MQIVNGGQPGLEVFIPRFTQVSIEKVETSQSGEIGEAMWKRPAQLAVVIKEQLI